MAVQGGEGVKAAVRDSVGVEEIADAVFILLIPPLVDFQIVCSTALR